MLRPLTPRPSLKRNANVGHRIRGVTYIFAAALLFPTVTHALDVSDIGTYRVLDKDRKPTAKVFRLAGGPGSWRLEDKQPDGNWLDVTCEGGCVLSSSTPLDHKRFFPADDISKVSMSCVHNTAFALCRYSRQLVPSERGYVFVALTEAHPIPLGLARE